MKLANFELDYQKAFVIEQWKWMRKTIIINGFRKDVDNE